VLKAMKYRIYPTKTQITLIEKHFGSTRFLYNYFLDYRQKEYAKGNKKVGYMITQAELTKLKKLDEYKWLNECGSQSLQMALRDLDSAFTRFFKKLGGYPKFHSKKHIHQSFTAPQNIKVANNRVYLPKFTKDGLKVKLHRDIPENATLKQASAERSKQMKQVGDDIFRPRLSQRTEVSLHTLGGFGQVGRSSMLLSTSESKILIDCGINPGARSPMDAYPRLDSLDLTLDDLDAVVIGHAHLDHTGFLPALCKYGYKGPIYCSEPTLPMMNLIQLDAIKVAAAQGRTPIYAERDVKQVMRQTITLPYGTVTDISPDIKLVLANAGHILGSALCHFHIGNGDHNFVYSGDIKFGKSILFEAASWNFPRVETLLIESTYGLREDVQPTRQQVESSFINAVNNTLADGGKVLIPIPAVGRAQEIMMVIDHYMKSGEMVEAPVFTEGMISEASAIHESYPEYLARELKQKILETDDNPFDSEYFTNIEHADAREEPMRENSPCIILATSGMLEGGPVLEYFKNIAPDKKNKVLFVSYQVNGTMGRRVLDGSKQVSMLGREGKVEVVSVNSSVERLDGFSGHSDYNQLMSFVQRLRPKLRRVLVNHGERSKSENLAMNIRRTYKLPAHYPQIQEAIKLF